MSIRTLQNTSAGNDTYRRGRFSALIRPLSYTLDLVIINVLAQLFFFQDFEYVSFMLFTGIFWVIGSSITRFYEVYRNTRFFSLFSMLFRQLVLFSFVVFAFFGFYNNVNRETLDIINYVLLVMAGIAILKFLIFFILKKYRVLLGGNYRKIIIIGDNSKTRNLAKFFEKNIDYGYHLSKLVDVNKKDFSLDDFFQYVLDNRIDEVYCSVGELSNKMINKIISFGDNNLRSIKFLPDNKDIYTRKLKFDYYGITPILALRDVPLDDSFNNSLKRAFDIIFSALVILLVLSWLVPIVAILIKLESKGPTFFKQKRNGLDYKEFECYKFRSMTPNKNANLKQATRGDQRVTRVGRILRKTSLDELPQFWNVFLGDMSVVGPRPHMVSHTHMYAKRIDKFMVRHLVKPGITGLAQVNGFRGEIETDKDIIGRVKFDIFYLENWSLFLDIRIIFQTVINAIRGEEKAY